MGKNTRLTPRQLQVLEDIDTGDVNRVYEQVRFRATGSVTRVIRRLVAMGLLDEERNAEVTIAGRCAMRAARAKTTPLMVECEECAGKGEYQASCNVCGVLLTEASAADECDDFCRVCAAKEGA
jgi:hypothetical protein